VGLSFDINTKEHMLSKWGILPQKSDSYKRAIVQYITALSIMTEAEFYYFVFHYVWQRIKTS
jgi:hypothetical protein